MNMLLIKSNNLFQPITFEQTKEHNSKQIKLTIKQTKFYNNLGKISNSYYREHFVFEFRIIY